MNNLNIKEIVEDLLNTFFNAGKLSLELREKGLTKKVKPDNTPVSNGDLEVNQLITSKLKMITPSIPIISEETPDNKSNNNLEDFWLVDPIDGTYDYINNLDEFTINAGLIINKEPVAGLINAPALGRMFYSFGPNLSFEICNGKTSKLECSKNFNKEKIKFVSYSNRLKPEIENIHKFFSLCDVGISSSKEEGFSNTVLEFLNYEKPVIATKVGGNAELINNKNGKLIESDNDKEMFEAMKCFMKKKNLKNYKENAKKVASKFTLKRMIDEYQKIYCEF